jgi:hypothetical protein
MVCSHLGQPEGFPHIYEKTPVLYVGLNHADNAHEKKHTPDAMHSFAEAYSLTVTCPQSVVFL